MKSLMQKQSQFFWRQIENSDWKWGDMSDGLLNIQQKTTMYLEVDSLSFFSSYSHVIDWTNLLRPNDLIKINGLERGKTP